jgi:ribonuclease HI
MSGFVGDGPPPKGLKRTKPGTLFTCETTCPKSARVPHQAKWLRFRSSTNILSESIVDQLARTVRADEDVAWIFADGSSNGGYGAAIVYPRQRAELRRDYTEPTKTRNVGAELNAVLLGLREVDAGKRVAVVCDYLGFVAWYSGNWRIKDPEVREKIEEARRIVEERGLTIERLVHHRGHQKDESDFTKWNNYADRLASLGGEEKPGTILLG